MHVYGVPLSFVFHAVVLPHATAGVVVVAAAVAATAAAAAAVDDDDDDGDDDDLLQWYEAAHLWSLLTLPLKTTVPQSVVLQRTPVHNSQISVRVVVYAPLCVRQGGNGVRYQALAKVLDDAVCCVFPDPLLLCVNILSSWSTSIGT